MTDIKLFQIHSRANLRGYRDVPIAWFVDKRDRPLFGPGGSFNVEPSDLIQDYRGSYHGYDSTDHLAEGFTEEEANAFAAWLRLNCNDDTATISQVKLPRPNNVMAFREIAVGGETGFLMISEAADYDLPFVVWGYYDVSESAWVAS